MFFTRDGHHVPIIDRYRGRPAFLIAGGPSLATIDKTQLQNPGILTMGYNNVVKTVRTKLWCSIDDPGKFLTSIWDDVTIEKFVPFDHAEKTICTSVIEGGKLVRKELGRVVGDCPNVLFFRRNEYFNADRYLFEDTINWGNHGEFGGSRTGLLAAFRILFLLGIRTIYLLGVDFKMDGQSKYCFPQDRHQGSINGNNETYREMTQRFTVLRPIFEKHGLDVLNCNPDSQLKVFDYLPYDEALEHCASFLPKDLANEPTEGLYEWDRNTKKPPVAVIQRQVVDAAHGVASPALPAFDPALTVPEAERAKKAATAALNKAKAELAALETVKAGAPPALLNQINEKVTEVSKLRARRQRCIADYNTIAGIKK